MKNQYFKTWRYTPYICENKKGESRQFCAEQLKIDSKQLAIPLQTHSNHVKYIDVSGKYADCDGLITSNANVVLSLQTADCVPIFMVDKSTGTRALIHAGWRGVVSNIVHTGMKLFQNNGIYPEKLHIFLGHAICGNCYEVGNEVANHFLESSKVQRDDGKWCVNLHKQIIEQLATFKIQKTQIKASTICTFESSNCCSYRRDGENAGHMFSFF